MYRPVKAAGDTVEVPQLVFSRLNAPGADDMRFRVALYMLASGGATAQQVATALGLARGKVEAALSYWEGAGLLEQDTPEPEAAPLPQKRSRLTTRETVRAGEADPRLGELLGEVQRLFGRVIGEKDINLFATLYSVDGYPAELILMAAMEGAGRDASRPAAYTESVLRDWGRQGVTDCAAADRLLKQRALQQDREQAIAGLMGLPGDPFTLAEKRRIEQWYEEYGYDIEMVEAARMAAGDKRNDVKYLSGILKKWHTKGYHSAKDVQQGEEGLNLRAQPQRSTPPGQDLLGQAGDYVPLKKKK